MLKLSCITKKYNNVTALSNISLTLLPGSVTGLLGPNGAGKTTLIRLLCGLIKPDDGEIIKDKLGVNGKSPDLAYLPEERGLYKNASAIENILYLTSLKGISGSIAKSKIIELARYFNAEQYLNERVGKLSKGNQQKIQLISVFAQDSQIVLLDEPYTGLDPFAQNQLNNLISDCAKINKIVVISTHLLQLAENICSDYLFLNNGLDIFNGSKKELHKKLYNPNLDKNLDVLSLPDIFKKMVDKENE